MYFELVNVWTKTGCVCVSTHPTNVLASGYHRACAESKSNILQAATHQLSSLKTF